MKDRLRIDRSIRKKGEENEMNKSDFADQLLLPIPRVFHCLNKLSMTGTIQA